MFVYMGVLTHVCDVMVNAVGGSEQSLAFLAVSMAIKWTSVLNLEEVFKLLCIQAFKMAASS